MLIEKKQQKELEILLLGPPIIRYKNSEINLDRRMVRSLLYYLACQTSPIGRVDLILLLWPDAPPAKGRQNLRVILSKLRTGLPNPDLIIVDHEHIFLNHKHVYVDVLDFTTQNAEINMLLQQFSPSTSIPRNIYKKMNSIINIWHGNRFLEGAKLPASDNFDWWLTEKEQNLEYHKIRLLDQFARQSVRFGDIDKAIATYQQALELDNMNLDMHFRLLSILHESNYQHDSQKYCHKLVKMLKKENIVINETFPALDSLIKNISNRAYNKKVLLPALSGPALKCSGTFIGNEDTLHTFRQNLKRNGLIILRGEKGIGKTRLVHESFSFFPPAENLLLRITAKPGDKQFPYQPLIDMLSNQILASQELMQIVQENHLQNKLQKLIEQNKQIITTHEDQKTLNTDKNLVFSTIIHETLQTLAQKHKIFILLDNAQWCDQHTLSVIQFIINRNFFQNYGICIIATRILDSSDPIILAFEKARYSNEVHNIAMKPLSQIESNKLIAQMLGNNPNYEFSKQLFNLTGGNPELIIEIVQAYLNLPENLSPEEQLSSISSCYNFQVFVHERLQELDEPTQNILQYAAVIGPQFSTRQLLNYKKISHLQLIKSLETLEKDQLINPLPMVAQDITYSFNHDLIRHVLVNKMSASKLWHLTQMLETNN